MKLATRHILPLFLGLIGFVSGGCPPKPEFPDVPAISNASFSDGTLRFAFTDGDGDIAIDESTTGSNLELLYYYRNASGQIVTYDLPSTLAVDSLILPYRITNLNVSPGSMEGDIQIKIDRFNIPHPQEFWFDIQLTDKAGHSSNVLRTPSLQYP